MSQMVKRMFVMLLRILFKLYNIIIFFNTFLNIFLKLLFHNYSVLDFEYLQTVFI